jgi:hypothetical protein
MKLINIYTLARKLSIALVCIITFSISCLSASLSDKATIRIITCGSGNEAYSVYGHSAIRVKDPLHGYDAVYNYGIFDFDSPHFLYRFAAGQTDYLLGVYNFNSFLREYKRTNRSVYEQELVISQAEKQKIFDFLQWNAKPENRTYRYNFFFDNCATRIRDVVTENIDGGINYNEKASNKTFRTLIKDYHSRLRWLNFGIDFLISADADKVATFQEEMFLPDYVMNDFATATRKTDGSLIVKPVKTLYQASENPQETSWLFGPFMIFIVLLFLVIIITVKQVKARNLKPALDYIIYGFSGFCGLFLMWFTIYSEHPAMSPNYNLMWLVPLNLLFAFCWIVKKWRQKLKYYYLIMSVWLLIFIGMSFFLPQKFHSVFYVIIAILIVRSAAHSFLILKSKNR